MRKPALKTSLGVDKMFLSLGKYLICTSRHRYGQFLTPKIEFAY